MRANVPEESAENSEWMFRRLIATLLRRSWRAGRDEFAVPDRVHAALVAIVDRAQAAVLGKQQPKLPRLM